MVLDTSYWITRSFILVNSETDVSYTSVSHVRRLLRDLHLELFKITLIHIPIYSMLLSQGLHCGVVKVIHVNFYTKKKQQQKQNHQINHSVKRNVISHSDKLMINQSNKLMISHSDKLMINQSNKLMISHSDKLMINQSNKLIMV